MGVWVQQLDWWWESSWLALSIFLGKPLGRRNFSPTSHSQSVSQSSFAVWTVLVQGPGTWKSGGRAKDTGRSWLGGGLSGFAFGIMLIKANEVMASDWYGDSLSRRRRRFQSCPPSLRYPSVAAAGYIKQYYTSSGSSRSLFVLFQLPSSYSLFYNITELAEK
jgi:hypothetical protein